MCADVLDVGGRDRDAAGLLLGSLVDLIERRELRQAHYDHVIEKFGDATQLGRYQTFFLDSITQLSRQCFAWCKTQPGAVSDRSGKPDLRAAYGLLGQEMISALTHLQHARGKNVVFVAILFPNPENLVLPGARLRGLPGLFCRADSARPQA